MLFGYFDIKSQPKKYFYILYVIDSNSRGCDGRSQIRGDAGDRTSTGFAENNAIEAGEKIGRGVGHKFSYITRLVARPNAEPPPSLLLLSSSSFQSALALVSTFDDSSL